MCKLTNDVPQVRTQAPKHIHAHQEYTDMFRPSIGIQSLRQLQTDGKGPNSTMLSANS